MEKQKYLDPKFALSLYPLMKFLKLKYGFAGSSAGNSLRSMSQIGGTLTHYTLNEELSMCSFRSTDNKMSANWSLINTVRQKEKYSMVEQEKEEDDDDECE
jgi:hypothetical protein